MSSEVQRLSHQIPSDIIVHVYCMSLHNVPGYPVAAYAPHVWRHGERPFVAGTIGLRLQLDGLTYLLLAMVSTYVQILIV